MVGELAGLLRTVDSRRRCSIPTTAEPLDTELLKNLSGSGKPPSFDGNDSEYQDFRSSFRIHMSLASPVSHTLMDRCEVERNPISLTAVRALGEAHLKCCMQMYYALALMTRGSVRTLIGSVEESNGAEAWRLIHSRICARHAESTIRVDAEDHDACETLVRSRGRF